jgi:hypothetical protein
MSQGYRDLHVLEDTSHCIKDVFDSMNNNRIFKISPESQGEISNQRQAVCRGIPRQGRKNEELLTNKVILEMDRLSFANGIVE